LPVSTEIHCTSSIFSDMSHSHTESIDRRGTVLGDSLKARQSGRRALSSNDDVRLLAARFRNQTRQGKQMVDHIGVAGIEAVFDRDKLYAVFSEISQQLFG